MRAVLAAGVAAAVLGLGPVAEAAQWSKSYSVSGVPELRLSTGDGTVRVEPGSGSSIDIDIDWVGYTLHDDFDIIESQQGSRVELQVKFRPGRWDIGFGRHSMTLVARVPKHLILDARTGDGGIHVTDLQGEILAHTGDGNVEVRGVEGRLKATSGDGRVRIAGRFDLLEVHTGDGSVDVEATSGSTVSMPWSITSGDGSVTLRLPGDLRANLAARTGDGRITCDLPVTVSGSFQPSRLSGTLNGGGGQVTVRTGDGSIRIDQSR